jgi:hypothetical protein
MSDTQGISSPGPYQSAVPSTGGATVPFSIEAPQTQVTNNFSGEFVQPFSPAEMQGAIKEATIPVLGGHSQTVPSSLQHQPPAQAGQAAMDYRPVVGKGNARAQGIGNAITGALNAVSSIVTAEGNKKQAKVADAAGIVFEAQKNIDEATAQLKIDPNNQAAKDTIAQNQARMQHLDPKMQKAILKGLQVDYTDPQKNKTSDHLAVAKAKEDFQKKFADRVASGMPQGMAPNQQAIAKVQYMQQANQQAAKLQQSIRPALIRASAQDRTNLSRHFTEVMKQQAEDARQDAKTREDEAFRMRVLNKEQQNAIRRIHEETAQAGAREQGRLDALKNDPNAVVKLLGDSDREWAARITSAQNTVANYDAQIATLRANPTTASSPMIEQLTTAKELAEGNLKSINRKSEWHHNYWSGQVAATGTKIQEESNGPANPGANNGAAAANTVNKANAAAYLIKSPRAGEDGEEDQ